MNERLKTHSKTQKKSADLVSNKLRIGVFQRYQMKCKSVSKKSPRYITVGIEISKHAWLNGGNGLFNLFNLVNGILWLSLMVIFLKDKQMGNSHEG